jgi:hypothetical protein
MDDNAVTPDEQGFGKLFNKLQEDIESSKPIELKQEDMMAQFSQTNYWQSLFKPMLEDRIEAYAHLSEVKFNGMETMEEIGVRFTLSSLVAKELQDIINTVELTTQVVNEAKEKNAKK